MKNTKNALKLKKLSGRVLTTDQLNNVNGGFVIIPPSAQNVDGGGGTCGGATCNASCSSCNSCVWWTCGDWSCAGTHCFC